jgi:hypothetical protein
MGLTRGGRTVAGCPRTHFASRSYPTPTATEVYKWFRRESSAYHGYGEWQVPAAPLQHIIANEMQRRTEMPGVYVPGAWKTTDMMERRR